MTPDQLHTTLKAAVEARMQLARAAGNPAFRYPSPWVLGTDQVIDDDGDTVVVGVSDLVAHIAANDPATILRHCERDLRVLERHAPRSGLHDTWITPCDGCGSYNRPCGEIRDLAAAYGVEVDGG